MSKETLENKTKVPEESGVKRRKLLGKIACALLALILWVYVSYDKNPMSSKSFSAIPVSIAGIDVLEERNLTVLSSDMYAYVKLSGARNILSKVKKDDIKAIVSVNDITTVGVQNPVLTITGIPDAINVEERKIISGNLLIDNLIKKDLEVKIDFVGKMDENVIEESKEVYPAHVTVKGAETALQDISVWTEPLDISNIKQSKTEFNTKILLKNKDGSAVKSDMIMVSDASAHVSLICTGKKEIPVAQPDIVGSMEGYEVIVEKIDPATIIISGMVEEVNILDKAEIEEIDAYNIVNEKVLRCELILPENITCETTHVNVTVAAKPIETSNVEE